MSRRGWFRAMVGGAQVDPGARQEDVLNQFVVAWNAWTGELVRGVRDWKKEKQVRERWGAVYKWMREG